MATGTEVQTQQIIREQQAYDARGSDENSQLRQPAEHQCRRFGKDQVHTGDWCAYWILKTLTNASGATEREHNSHVKSIMTMKALVEQWFIPKYHPLRRQVLCCSVLCFR